MQKNVIINASSCFDFVDDVVGYKFDDHNMLVADPEDDRI
jgi:hypothetical protein